MPANYCLNFYVHTCNKLQRSHFFFGKGKVGHLFANISRFTKFWFAYGVVVSLLKVCYYVFGLFQQSLCIIRFLNTWLTEADVNVVHSVAWCQQLRCKQNLIKIATFTEAQIKDETNTPYTNPYLVNPLVLDQNMGKTFRSHDIWIFNVLNGF